jgi:uncharacterized membrane protein YqaE (UPF0057 family)
MSSNNDLKYFNSLINYSKKKVKLNEKMLIVTFLDKKEIINLKDYDANVALIDILLKNEILDYKINLVNILSDYHFVLNGNKLLDPYQTIDQISNNNEIIINLSINPTLKGGIGIGDFLEELFDFITSVVDFIFDPITKPLAIIGDVIRFFLKIVVWLIETFFWMLFFIIWAVKDILLNLPGGFVNALKVITTAILLAIPETLVGIMKMLTNTFVKYVFSGFWGWDTVPANPNDFKNSKFLQRLRSQKTNRKCYVSDSGSVPFSVIMGTVFMPPIGVFMTLGLSGWMHIIIASLLTLAFYFPGLMYALIIVYC